MEVMGTDMGEIMGYLIAKRRNIPIIRSFLGVDNKKVFGEIYSFDKNNCL